MLRFWAALPPSPPLPPPSPSLPPPPPSPYQAGFTRRCRANDLPAPARIRGPANHVVRRLVEATTPPPVSPRKLAARESFVLSSHAILCVHELDVVNALPLDVRFSAESSVQVLIGRNSCISRIIYRLSFLSFFFPFSSLVLLATLKMLQF